MHLLASLAMYDWPETADALDRLWSAIAGQLNNNGIEAPDTLTRSQPLADLLNSPELIIGQTCGWPYANFLRRYVIPFARFQYDINVTPAGHYFSVYIGNTDADRRYINSPTDFSEVEKIAFNSPDSQSGFNVFSEIADRKALEAIPAAKHVITGSHRASIRAVAEGAAQIAAIDAVSYALAYRHDQDVIARTVFLGTSEPKPGLPLVTPLANIAYIPTLLTSVNAAVSSVDQNVLDTLLIKGVCEAEDSEYDIFEDS